MRVMAIHKPMWVGRARTLAYCILGLLVATSIGVLLAAKPAHAVEFRVNSTQDAGDYILDGECAIEAVPAGTRGTCTLRAAIQEANVTTAVDTINFGIPGEGPHTISPASSLPLITQPVTINGYSETGASQNTLLVGNNAVVLIRLDGSNVSSGSGLELQASNTTIKGLSITKFANDGIRIRGPGRGSNTVEGNFVGITPGGQAMGNGSGVTITSDSSNNTVGGTSPEARNIISGNDGIGVNISTAVDQSTMPSKVIGNYIGTTKSGTGNLGNSGSGVSVETRDNTIGDDNPNDGLTNAANIIAFNGADGVSVSSETGNSILSNSIFSNADLGIDLGANGRTANDGVGDADIGANNLQNYPVITSAKTGRRATTIKGTLESTQGGAFTIQFFSNPKGARDEGKKFIGEQFVTDSGDGHTDGKISFTFKPPKKVKAGLFVTATATKVAEDDTSEFSAPKRVRG